MPLSPQHGDFERDRLWPNDRTGPWRLTTQFRLIDGRLECVGLHIDAERSVILTGEVLRKIRIPELISEAGRSLRAIIRTQVRERYVIVKRDGRRLSDPEAEASLRRRAGLAEPAVTGRPAYWHRARLEQVARVYLDATSRGKSPTMAVAEHFQKSHSMAAKLVRLARKEGLLPLTTPGRARGAEEASVTRARRRSR